MWSIETRVEKLRYEYLPALDAHWAGTDAEFVEFLHRSINAMPPKIAKVMRRSYIDGDMPEKDEFTGKRLKHDNSYYNLLLTGRAILATRLREAQEHPELTSLIGRTYGR